VYAATASPVSLAAHLPHGFGTRVYEAIERVAALPQVETVLAEEALQRGDLATAEHHAAQVPPGDIRSDLQARIAAAHGDTPTAIRHFLDAGDDKALQVIVASWQRAGRVREAYDLERRIEDRLASAGTRPNALADSSWRLGRLALRLGNVEEAARDYGRAIALAPLNTKYLIDAGTTELERRNLAKAAAYFERARRLDASDANPVAGLGLAALKSGDTARAVRLAAQADALGGHAALALRLHLALGHESAAGERR
jgi:tetratricopeptide (TPR) repeat protein